MTDSEAEIILDQGFTIKLINIWKEIIAIWNKKKKL